EGVFGNVFDGSVDYAATDNAPAAWARKLDGTGVGIAVLDSGVSVTNANDFGSRLTRIALTGQNSKALDDTHGHGTFVAGVAAGNNASSTYQGIAPGAKVFALKVTDSSGKVRTSNIVQALNWASTDGYNRYGVRVAILSLSEDAPSSYEGSILDAAVEHAWRVGVTVVVSAGNLGPDSTYFAPATDPFPT